MTEFTQNPPDVYGFGHTEYLQNVVHSIQDRKAQLVDGLAGRKSLEIVTAIYESIETKKEVTIRFTPKNVGWGERRIDL